VHLVCFYYKNCQLYIKNASWFTAWRWLHKEAETCRWFNYLFIYILYNKGCVRRKLVYICVNYWKNNGNASTVQLIEIKFPTLTQQTVPALSVRVAVIIPMLTAVKQVRHGREIFPGLLIRTQWVARLTDRRQSKWMKTRPWSQDVAYGDTATYPVVHFPWKSYCYSACKKCRLVMPFHHAFP